MDSTHPRPHEPGRDALHRLYVQAITEESERQGVPVDNVAPWIADAVIVVRDEELRFAYRHAYRLQAKLGRTVSRQEAAERQLAAIRKAVNELNRWATTELVTDDGFAQRCVLEATRVVRRILDDHGEGDAG